jgi:hypothetical protein
MAKRHYLSIEAGYLANWDLWSGIRELVQNARDAEIQDDAPMKVEYLFRMRNKVPIGTIVITNEGTTIPKEAFLIGHSSKQNRSDLIGKFGEGLKFGILALLKIDGIEIKIRNGAESWNPVICQSKDYDAQVLAFDVAEGNKFENRVQIEILGISSENWTQIKSRFLFLEQPEKESIVTVYGGSILLEDKYKGMLFDRGIYICTDKTLTYGYDLHPAEVDRDRKMISNVSWSTGKLLNAALAEGKLTNQVYKLLHDGDPQINNLWSSSLAPDAITTLVNKFHEQYGENAIPVESEEEIVELSHLGVKGIRLPYNINNILSAQLGGAKKNIAKLKMNARHTFDRSDLTPEETSVLDAALRLLNKANMMITESVLFTKIHIVEFVDSKFAGMYNTEDGTIQIARNQLVSLPRTLRILIHEGAHKYGVDGTKQHEEAIGNLTEAVFKLLIDCYD